MANNKKDLKALKRLISQAALVVDTIPAHPSVKRAKELLNAAEKLAEDLATVSPAVELGAKGGNKTAERGPEFYKRIAAMRKTRAGGRPRKNAATEPAKVEPATKPKIDFGARFVAALNANVRAADEKAKKKD